MRQPDHLPGLGSVMEENAPILKARSKSTHLRRLENYLGFLAGFNCVLVALFFTFQELSLPFRAPLDLWPFPALYFVELLFTGAGTAYFIARNQGPRPNRWNGLPWISAGVLLAFVIIGIFSIGIFLIPAMLSFLAAGILGDRRQAGNWPTHAMYFFFAAMAQAVVVFLIQMISR
jgi:hypothetical protein